MQGIYEIGCTLLPAKHILALCYHHRSRFAGNHNTKGESPPRNMDELASILVPTEEFMTEVPAFSVGSRRDEDIALDLMKFVAMTTGYGRTSSTGVGFQGGGAASKPEEYASHLLELYGKCLGAVQGKR